MYSSQPCACCAGSTLINKGFLRVAKWNETRNTSTWTKNSWQALKNEDYDRFIERVDRRKQAVKKGKAAWSKLEDVLAEKRLQKELKDFYEDT